MNKLSILFLAAAGLALASCSQDDINNNVSKGDAHVTFSVSLPDFRTRALGDGSAATTLKVLVFDAQDNEFLYDNGNGVTFTEPTVNVDLDLITGSSYKIVFFAANSAAMTGTKPVYTIDTESGSLNVTYANMNSADNNADDYDCFYHTYTAESVTSGSIVPVTLTRPVAQINWGSTKLTENSESNFSNTFGDNGQYMQTTLKTTAYTSLNLFTGELSGEDEVTLGAFAAPQESSFPTIDGSPVDYDYVAMQYLLAPSKATIANLTLTISNNVDGNTASTYTNDIDVTNAPLQANYKTNIYGNLLTGNVSLEVSTSVMWSGSNDKEMVPTFDVEMSLDEPLTIDEDGLYKLSGNLQPESNTSNNQSYYVNLTYGIEAVIDGTNLSCTSSDQTFHLIFQDNTAYPGSQADITNPKRPIAGSLTFQNFPEGNISIKTGSTTINITNNTITALDLRGGNLNLNINDNLFKSDGQKHLRIDNVLNDYNCYMYVIKYNLNFNNNYMYGDPNGGPVQINGWSLNEPIGSWTTPDLLDLNTITSFSGNTLVVEELKNTDSSRWTAAITFYGDSTFYWTNTDSSSPTFTQAAIDFMTLVKNSDNKFYIAGDATGANMFKFSQLDSGDSVRLDPFQTPLPAESTEPGN